MSEAAMETVLFCIPLRARPMERRMRAGDKARAPGCELSTAPSLGPAQAHEQRRAPRQRQQGAWQVTLTLETLSAASVRSPTINLRRRGRRRLPAACSAEAGSVSKALRMMIAHRKAPSPLDLIALMIFFVCFCLCVFVVAPCTIIISLTKPMLAHSRAIYRWSNDAGKHAPTQTSRQC